ncbi:hypothetical protein [Emticicia fontis]
MEVTKPIVANKGILLEDKVETPNRLEALFLKYPKKFEDFREFFRQNGVSDQVLYNLRKGRQIIKPPYKKLIDRLVLTHELIE